MKRCAAVVIIVMILATFALPAEESHIKPMDSKVVEIWDVKQA